MLQKIYRAPFFDNSIRVFFTLAAMWAILVPVYTVTVIVNDYPFPFNDFSIYEWHGYQMMCGFFYTLVTGYILTAGAHWTGVRPPNGLYLFVLFILWLSENISFLIIKSKFLIIVMTISFILLFLYKLTKTLQDYKNKRRYLSLIYGLSVIKVLYLLDLLKLVNLNRNLISNLPMWIYVLLVTIIAGKIIPRFTKNFFKLTYNLDEPDFIKIPLIIFSCTLFLNSFDAVPTRIKFSITLVSAILNFIRLGFWLPYKAIKFPTIGFLHIGYFLFSSSILFKALTLALPNLDMYRSSLHFILLGAITFIAMNVMIRASLGHTGRKIHFNLYTILIFICLLIGTIIRVFIPILCPIWFIPSLHHSMGWWTLGFILYLIKFFPIFLKSRI